MQHYTKSITYIQPEIDINNIISFNIPEFYRLKIDPEHPSYKDTDNVFTQEKFKYPYLPLYLGEYNIESEQIKSNYLRLIIRENKSNAEVYIPKDLLPLKDFLIDNINYHRQFYPGNKDCFIYLTVRSSTYEELYYKNSQTWHIDGFQGSRINRHIIEQDILWSNKSPTEFLLQPFFCEGLNPSKHDINLYFEENAEEKYIIKSKSNSLYLATPYNVHRVNKGKFEGKRLFLRLNFSPVLIEDFTNTVNPKLNYTFPVREDVRNFLWRYNSNEKVDSGFEF